VTRSRDIIDALVHEGSSPLRGEPVYEKLDSDAKEEVDKRVEKALKSKEAKDSIRKIAVEVLNDFVKTLYVKRGFWTNDVK
jgi:hypothetical protein